MRSRRRHHFEPSRRPSIVPPLALDTFSPNRVTVTVPSINNNGINGGTEANTISPSQDSRVITYMWVIKSFESKKWKQNFFRKFVEVFMSGKMQFENPHEEYKFSPDDLIDLGEIGRGRFGVVNKMKHTASGRIMAIKVVISFL